jgi:uncharacterized coiled-coil protein SlyX
MTIKSTTSTQLTAVDTLKRVIAERRLPSKSETEWFIAQLDALSARLKKAQEAEYARERQREARDAAEVMGGSE